jgi:uncharacterized protein YjeT (DUF2065 family)
MNDLEAVGASIALAVLSVPRCLAVIDGLSDAFQWVLQPKGAEQANLALVCCPDERLRNIGKVGISSSTGAFSLM